MTSSMLAGERRWASARRGGMTVLGKVAVPKPINLPSQKLENHGLDPNVEIVPKGSLSWGNKPSSSTSNPWGPSSVSSNADGRPSSSGGLSRPSTAGSDRLEPSSTAWGPNSRPSSASGVITSNQSSLTSSRPLSAETRPGSSHLSRFAEPAYDNSAWGPNGNGDKLTVHSKVNDFSLSSGEFPTLGSEKDNTTKNVELHDHGSHVRPGSGSGRTASVKERNITTQDHKSGTVDTWTRDGSLHFEDGGRNNDRWQQGDPQQYIPPPHFDAWRGPPMNAPPGGVWYRGPPPPQPPPPPAGPSYPPVPHAGYPMEPYPPYYRPQIPNNLANPQSGPGPRAHHPRNGDFYRPQMAEPFMRPNMPMRPGYYPGPLPYDGYYGPPMGYSPNDRDIQFMGMPPGPPVYNMVPPPNAPEFHDPHFRGGLRGPVGKTFVSEQSDSVPPEESRGPYKVLRKRENEKDVNVGDNSEQNIENNDETTRPSFHKNEDENVRFRRNFVHSSEGPHKSRGPTESCGNKSSFSETPLEIPANKKDPILIQKIEGSNAEIQTSDTEQKNRLLIHSNDNPTIAFGTICDTGALSFSKPTTANVSSFSRQSHHGVRIRADHQNKGRLNNQDTDGWRKKPIILASDVASAETLETPNTNESLNPTVDPKDDLAQRARKREMAKQRAIQLQKEEEERIKEQKAKARAKLEELNRRTSDGTTQTAENTTTNVSDPEEDVGAFAKPTGPIIGGTKPDPPSSGSDTKAQSAAKTNDRQKHASHKQKSSVQMVDTSSVSGTVEAVKAPAGAVINDSFSNVIASVESVPQQEYSPNTSSESTQQRKKNNKSSKNKHKPDGDIAKVSVKTGKTDSPPSDKLPNNHFKPQHSSRISRHPHVNRPVDRFHVGDIAVWAPVRGPQVDEHSQKAVQDDVALSVTSVSSGQTNLKSKRAEMERYVPKPVAKELAQQESVNPLPSAPVKITLDDSIMESKGGDNKHNKQMKPHGAWKQQDAKKNNHESKPEAPRHFQTETNVVHEWDPSDGWCMPDEYPPTEVIPVTSVAKGKKLSYKAHKSTIKTNNVDYNDISGAEVEIENGSSHWQPKPQGYRGGWSGGGQNVSSEVKTVRPDEPVTDYKNGRGARNDGGHQEIRKERKPASYEASFEHHHGSTGFRKYGGQSNRSVGQDDRRKHNQNNANINRERVRQNLHYEYQPVGSNSNSDKSSTVDAPADTGPKYKERGSGSGSGYSRRGGSNFNGRQ